MKAKSFRIQNEILDRKHLEKYEHFLARKAERENNKRCWRMFLRRSS